MPDKIEVQIREGSTSGNILARDQISALGLRRGSGALTVVLTNEAHAIPEDETGALDFTGSGTEIQLWEGIEQLVYDGVVLQTERGKLTPQILYLQM